VNAENLAELLHLLLVAVRVEVGEEDAEAAVERPYG
jgi:hypothetical protein